MRQNIAYDYASKHCALLCVKNIAHDYASKHCARLCAKTLRMIMRQTTAQDYASKHCARLCVKTLRTITCQNIARRDALARQDARERSGPRLSYIPPLTLHNYTAAYCPGEVCSSGGGPSACLGGLMQAWSRFICDLLRVEELEVEVEPRRQAPGYLNGRPITPI